MRNRARHDPQLQDQVTAIVLALLDMRRDRGRAQADRHVEIIFFSMPTPAATARSYSSGTVAESCSAMPVGVKECDLVVGAASLLLPVMTSPMSPAMSSSRMSPLDSGGTSRKR